MEIGDPVEQSEPELNRHSSPTPIMILGPTPARTEKDSIPEEILEEILCRTPARKVCQFRAVCKHWKALTSTPEISRMHLKYWYNNYLSELLIEKKSRRGSDPEKSIRLKISPAVSNPRYYGSSSYSLLYACPLESASSSTLTAGMIRNGCSRKTVSFSALGFVVLRVMKLSASRCVILNPLTREKVKLMIAYEDARLDGRVYAIYLHPKLQEVCVLWGQRERYSSVTTEFKLLNLKSAFETGNSCWRSIVPRLHRYSPRRYSDHVVPPVILNNVLYWMIDCLDAEISCEDTILAFDVQAEEFKMLPHPGTHCGEFDDVRRNHKRMHLLQTRSEHLSLCAFSPKLEFITVWEREHSGNWIVKNSVQVSDLLHSSRMYDDCCRVFGMMDEDFMLLKKGEFGALYVLNLKQGSVEVLEAEGVENRLSFVCTHTPSFASLTSSSLGGEARVQVPTGVRAIKHLKHVVY